MLLFSSGKRVLDCVKRRHLHFESALFSSAHGLGDVMFQRRSRHPAS